MAKKAYTQKTFIKIRKFLNYSYRNPQLNLNRLMEMVTPILRNKEDDGLSKPHPPKDEIVAILDPGIYDYEKSFQRNPNPHRSIIFKLNILNENPFHEFWKLFTFSDLKKDIYNTILRDELQETPFTIKGFGELASQEIGIVDDSLAGKELRKSGQKGVLKTYTVPAKNRDFHVMNMMDSSFETAEPGLHSLIEHYSKVGPCSAIGSFIMDRFFSESASDVIRPFEKKFLINSLDSQIMYDIFDAVSESAKITIRTTTNACSESEEKTVSPLFVVRSDRTGHYALVYTYERKRGICDISRILNVTKERSHFKIRPGVLKLMKENFSSKFWDIPDDGTYGRNNIRNIQFKITGCLTDEEVARFYPLSVKLGKTDTAVSGEVHAVEVILPEIFRYIGRIKEITVGKPEWLQVEREGWIRSISYIDSDWFNQEDLFFNFRELFEAYDIELPSNYMLPPCAYSDMMGKQSYGLYPGPGRTETVKIPYRIEEKHYEEDSSLFHYFYSKDYVRVAKDEQAEIPVTTPELRWLRSVINYEGNATDVPDEFMQWLDTQSPKELFSSRTFMTIRHTHYTEVYEETAASMECKLSFVAFDAGELFTVFPETRENLAKNLSNQVVTSFHYNKEDEDFLLPLLISLGKTVKVDGPEHLVTRIRSKLEAQKKLFARWKHIGRDGGRPYSL